MKVLRKFAFLLLLTGFLAYSEASVEADNSCQQQCSASYQGCVANANDGYETCAFNAESSYQNCMNSADSSYSMCMQNCEHYPQFSGCVDDCNYRYFDAQVRCTDNWENAEGFCFDLKWAAINFCESQYTACYNNCPP
jgi:hypothetical protein